MKKDIICTVCPMGCKLTVSKENEIYKVEGNTCNRGENYGIEEITNPTRVLTTTVKLTNSYLNQLPVKTDTPVPKDKLIKIMQALNKTKINAPIKNGEIIIENILNTGSNLVSTKSMPKIN